jgi:hypothetical protein
MRREWTVLRFLCGFVAVITTVSPARAQTAAPPPTTAPQMLPPPPAPPGPPPTSAPQMLPPPPPPAAPVPVAAPTMAPAPPTTLVATAPAPTAAPLPAPPPPPPPPSAGNLTIGYTFGTRVGIRLQDQQKPKDMTEIHLDPYAYDTTVEARFHGSVTQQFSWVANFNATLLAPTLAAPATVGVMDLIAQFKAAKEFQIWAGRLLVPSDRSNFTGPFFMVPWNYPGFYFPGAPPLGPKDGPTGRDQGTTVWGNAFDDKLKYYVGAHGIDITGAGTQPYFSGRVSYSIQGSEPGYFGSSTYYGAKNVFTIGVSGQYQHNGAIDTATPGTTVATACPTAAAVDCKDMATFMADALAEESFAGVGSFDFEGQFYKFTQGYDFGPTFAPGEAFYLLAAYLTPDLGFGKLQPMVRWQQTADPAWTVIDAALAYVFKDYSGRVVATYQHIDRGTSATAGPNPIQNSIQLGIQLQSL